MRSTSDLGDGMHGLVAVGASGTATSRMQMVMVNNEAQSDVDFGAFGDERVDFAANCYVDSYDSSLGSYASQSTNRLGSKSYALTNGNVGSNGSLSMDSNTVVFGNATAGPGGDFGCDFAVVGGAMSNAAALRELPAVVVPTLPSSGSISQRRGTLTAPAGKYRYTSILIRQNSTVTFTGPATIVTESLEVNSNSSLLFDTTDGPVEIFVTGDMILDQNIEFRPLNYDPTDLTVNVTASGCSDVSFSSNIEFYGKLYAPTVDVELRSNVEIFGSVTAGRLDVRSNSAIHRDESLIGSGEESPAVVARWGFTMPSSGTTSTRNTAGSTSSFELMTEDDPTIRVVREFEQITGTYSLSD